MKDNQSMNDSRITCDPHRVELFLREQLTDRERTLFEQHLEECEECRRQLESSAAAEDVWSEVRESLSSESPVGDSQPESLSHDGTFSHETVLNLLAPTDDDRMLGRVGAYEIQGIVGSSAMAVVLKAFDASLNRYVAIKLLAPHLGSSGAARQRFSREAQAAAAVVHENVIEIHGVADLNGLPYLVMPYVSGPSLQRRLDDSGPLALAEILRVGMQAAMGLAAAHAQGLVHRDVKPANILLAEGVERTKLTDFGLARAVDDASLTRTGIIAGTPQYMSPEQARGESVDARSDLFSLGSVMYAMCTGRAPFRSETSYGVLRRITDDEPRPVREINSDVPDWLCDIITRLMSKDRNDRFESAEDVASLLKTCLAHVQQPTVVLLPKQCVKKSNPGMSKRNGMFAVLTIIIVVIGSIAYWSGGVDRDETPPDQPRGANATPQAGQLSLGDIETTLTVLDVMKKTLLTAPPKSDFPRWMAEQEMGHVGYDNVKGGGLFGVRGTKLTYLESCRHWGDAETLSDSDLRTILEGNGRRAAMLAEHADPATKPLRFNEGGFVGVLTAEGDMSILQVVDSDPARRAVRLIVRPRPAENVREPQPSAERQQDSSERSLSPEVAGLLNPQPQISIIHPGIDALKVDLQALFRLTSGQEHEYGDELRAFIDDLAYETDGSHPIRIDVGTHGDEVTYLTWLPYINLHEFVRNLESIGFPFDEQAGHPNLFALNDPRDQGWLCVFPERRYAALALTTPETDQAMQATLLAASTPGMNVDQLYGREPSVAARLTNIYTGSAGQQARQERFRNVRVGDLADLKIRPDESKSAYELRRRSSGFLYDEVGRLFVEAKSAAISVLLDRDRTDLLIGFDTTAIPDTSLADSIAQFGDRPDDFASVTPVKDSVLSLRVNHPVDGLRQRNGTVYLTLLAADIRNRIDASPDLTKAERLSTQLVVDNLIDAGKSTLTAGHLNSFVEASHDGTDFSLVCAMSVPGAARLKDTLNQLPTARTGNSVDQIAPPVGETDLYRIRLTEGFLPVIDSLFGVARECFVGLAGNRLWLAAGPDAEKLIRKSIAEIGPPELSAHALNIEMKLAPWANWLHQQEKKRDPPANVEARTAQRETLIKLETLVESLSNEDELSASIRRSDSILVGTLKLGKGMLTFFARGLARWTKENLEL